MISRPFTRTGSREGLVALVVALLLVLAGCGGDAGSTAPTMEGANAAPEGANAAPGAPSNLLLVTLDTTRAELLSLYGWPMPTSPSLEALAARGVVFDAAYAPMAETLPTHTSLMTGLAPREHGVMANSFRVEPSLVTLAEALHERGYDTAAFISANVLSSRSGIEAGFGHYDEELAEERVAGRSRGERPAEDTVDAVLTWFDSRPPEASAPWFAWTHLFDAHLPYAAPRDAHRPFRIAGIYELLESDPRRWLGTADVPPSDELVSIASLWLEYLAELRHADEQLGRLIAELEARELLDDTLVVVVGDHGEGLETHGDFGHSVHVHEELMRVPLVVRTPDEAGAGLRLDEAFPLSELRLILEGVLAGEGVGLERWEHALRTSSLPSVPVFMERPYRTAKSLESMQKAGRDVLPAGLLAAVLEDDWKLVREPDGTERLYALEHDPGETHDLAEAREAVRRRLSTRLDDWLEEFGTGDAGPDGLSEERLLELQELGYLK